MPLLLALLAAAAPPPQTEADGYTRYELLAPATESFRILYEVTATAAGATRYYNPIRPGSTARDERVTDRATGRPLPFREVDGAAAKAGGIAGAAPDSRWIEVTLARPVPKDGGEARLLIDKTYRDAASYHADGRDILFERGLGVKRNAVVLPPGYALVSSNYPAQILQEPDGRLKIAFWNTTPAEAPLKLRARPAGLAAARSSQAGSLDERAHQNREIVYSLRAPETHAFDLFHDYTEERPGVSTYVNLVRPGSRVANPSARNLDTGAAIPAETVRGRAAVQAAEPGARDLSDDAEAVVFRFPAVKPGTSTRLRISETYTDPARYLERDGELVWHRGLGRPANAVILPAGWLLTNSSVPATVSETADGRTRLDFLNPRTDELDVIVTARRRG